MLGHSRFHHAGLISAIVDKRDRLIVRYEWDYKVTWWNSIGVSRRGKILWWNSAETCNDEFQDLKHPRNVAVLSRRHRWEFNFANRRRFASHLALNANFKREIRATTVSMDQIKASSRRVWKRVSVPESFPQVVLHQGISYLDFLSQWDLSGHLELRAVLNKIVDKVHHAIEWDVLKDRGRSVID